MARVLCVLLHNLENKQQNQKQEKENSAKENYTTDKDYTQAQTRQLLSKDFIPKLLRWAYRFSPVVALDRNDNSYLSIDALNSSTNSAPTLKLDPKLGKCLGINLDVTGAERLFRGEQRLLARIQAELKSYQLQSRLCIAPTLGCAWAISRYAELNPKYFDNDALEIRDLNISVIVQTNAIRKHLEPLPIEALRLNKKTLTALNELNITSVKQALLIPRSALHNRFGRELPLRINQALGLEQEVLDAVAYSPLTKVQKIFDSPLENLEQLKHQAEILLSELLKKIDRNLHKVARFSIEIKQLNQPKIFKEISLNLATSDERHLWRLLKTKLENLSLPAPLTNQNGIEQVALYLPKTEEFICTNSSFLPPSAERNQPPLQLSPFAELLDSLREQLGPKNVLYLEPKTTHIPEQVSNYVPAAKAILKNSTASELSQTDRPSLLFYQPQPISAMAVLPDTPPFWLKWKNTTYRIISGIGPERIEPEWWGKDQELCLSRDYFKVQLPCGTWLWIYREIVRSSWFVHGIWA